MNIENYEMIIFQIISHAGEARALAFEALEYAENGDFDKADEYMAKASEEFLNAHKIQTDIIQKEAAGENITVTVLFVHAQDHLMTAQTEKVLIEKLIGMNKRLWKLEEGKI